MVISEEIILKARHFPVMGYKACKVVHGGKYVSPKLAEQMGEHYAVFLKGHGIVVSERTIEGNSVSAIWLERACLDQLLLKSFSESEPLTDGARGRIRSRIDHRYRIWPCLLYHHGIRSKKEAKKLTRSMIKSIWPDEVP